MLNLNVLVSVRNCRTQDTENTLMQGSCSTTTGQNLPFPERKTAANELTKAAALLPN